MATLMRIECWKEGPCLFRASTHSYTNEWPKIVIESYVILSYTACGVWVEHYRGKKKFINLRAEKQWTSTTEAEAIRQLKFRKAAQVRILTNLLTSAERDWEMLQEEIEETPKTKPEALSFSFNK